MKKVLNNSVQNTGTDNVNVETAVGETEVKTVKVVTVAETTDAGNLVVTTGTDAVVETETAETVVEIDSTEKDDINPGENNTADEKSIDFYLSEEEQNKETASQSKTKAEQVVENTAAMDKFKLSNLRRSLENKKATLEREKAKCTDWVTQGNHRDEKATEEYEKRKTELEELIKKNQERFDKRMAKTKTQWHDYVVNYEATKIKKLEDEVTLLQLELEKATASVEIQAVAA